ncbi:YciI family protein [Erythrobacter sp. MTPC3]|uniref:YciI family protein n=1 Tax=Erythrobacter sp. MTPC3 TaxID=3056564 RepID=UPI0036F2DCB1
MALFCFHCRDGEAGERLREIHRETHLAHIAANLHDYAVAGPLKQDGKIIGSMLVIKAEDDDDARAKLEADPYFTAGVWQSIRVDAFTPLFGDWMPPDSETD